MHDSLTCLNQVEAIHRTAEVAKQEGEQEALEV